MPEALWATPGAVTLVLLGCLPLTAALSAVARGAAVYLFLAGMMLLAALARSEGLFESLDALAVRLARGSASRLFLLVYAIGAVVTISMSNGATAVVLTPAVYAVTKKAGAKPLPYLFACALIANAASFVLPISNPANLVLLGSQPPPLIDGLRQFSLASVLSIVATFAVLRFLFRAPLAGLVETGTASVPLSRTSKLAAWDIVGVAGALLTASSRHMQLGLPTLLAAARVAAALVATVVFLIKRQCMWAILGSMSWSVLSLVAGLFVLVHEPPRL